MSHCGLHGRGSLRDPAARDASYLVRKARLRTDRPIRRAIRLHRRGAAYARAVEILTNATRNAMAL
jgi:hypothetical protein